MGEEREDYARPPLVRMLWRGARRRCPQCGGGELFEGWLRPRDSCPRCQLRLNRGEGDFFLGPYVLSFIAVELVLVAYLFLSVMLSWPDVRWDLLLWLGVPLIVLFPIGFYPFSRTLWLAVDLAMRPPGPADFEEPGSGSPRLS